MFALKYLYSKLLVPELWHLHQIYTCILHSECYGPALSLRDSHLKPRCQSLPSSKKPCQTKTSKLQGRTYKLLQNLLSFETIQTFHYLFIPCYLLHLYGILFTTNTSQHKIAEKNKCKRPEQSFRLKQASDEFPIAALYSECVNAVTDSLFKMSSIRGQ